MKNVSAVGNLAAMQQYEVYKNNSNVRAVNFRADKDTFVKQNTNPYGSQGGYSDYDPILEQQMRMLEEQQKQAKKQQRTQKVATAVSIGAGIAIIATLFLTMFSKKFDKAVLKLKTIDVSKCDNLKDLKYSDDVQRQFDTFINRIKNGQELEKKGARGKGVSAILTGPPGTGKNTATYAIAKEFPDSKLYDLDISGLNSKYYGETEQNIMGTIDKIVAEANKNKNRKHFVFIDEIDSVMMTDIGNGAKHSNDILNAFKRGFNKLTDVENIIVIGATNLKLDAKIAAKEGKVLDSAMLSRFSDKILIDKPNSKQLRYAMTKHYGKAKHSMVAKELKDYNNRRLQKLCEFLARPEHNASFRTLNSIYENAASISGKGKNVTLNDVIIAVANKRDELNLNAKEIRELRRMMK